MALFRIFLLCLLTLFVCVLAVPVPPKPLIPSKYALVSKWHKMGQQEETKGLMCIACTLLVDGMQVMLQQNKTDQELEDFVKKTCKSLGVEAPYVCDHIVNEFGDEIFFVLERVIFTPHEICGAFVKDCGVAVNPLNMLWNITIPKNKPTVKSWPVPKPNMPTLRVLHLSDIHIDRHYVEGSEADCDADHPLYEFCCLVYPDTAREPVKVPALKWGMPYKCDIPYRTFDSAMRHLAANEKFDYIIVTGDMEAHNIWDYSKEDTKTNLVNITSTIRSFFPTTPIYESVGNHEGVPMDAMAFHGMEEYAERGPQWLYTTLATNWKKWLPDSAIENIKYRASYVVRPLPGLKLISLNTVYCSQMNLYNYINQVDPDGTLAWLISELVDSESKNEKVHIVSHIPPGDNYCLKGWAHNFYEIVNRFENTIAAQFYGHTHNDHFQVYYENGDPKKRATHFNFITPSLTTYSFANPAWRVYTIDGNYAGSSYTVIDADTYSTDLNEANKKDVEPKWFHTYNTRELYGMKDLSPTSWNELIGRLDKDDSLFQKFMWNFKRYDGAHNGCDAECKKEKICGMKSAKSHTQEIFCPEMAS